MKKSVATYALILVMFGSLLVPVASFAQTLPTPPAPTTTTSPAGTSAQTTTTQSAGCRLQTGSSFRQIAAYPVCVINTYVFPLLIGIAVFSFMIGVVRYMMELENDTKRLEMRNFIMWSSLALFVILSVWGILLVMQNSFRLG
jgi:hypothetical protein